MPSIEEIEQMLIKAKEEQKLGTLQPIEMPFDLALSVFSTGKAFYSIKSCKGNTIKETINNMETLSKWVIDKNKEMNPEQPKQ